MKKPRRRLPSVRKVDLGDGYKIRFDDRVRKATKASWRGTILWGSDEAIVGHFETDDAGETVFHPLLGSPKDPGLDFAHRAMGKTPSHAELKDPRVWVLLWAEAMAFYKCKMTFEEYLTRAAEVTRAE